MKKYIINVPDDVYATLLSIYESNNPRPETVMQEGVEITNPYNSNQMMDMLIGSLIRINFTRILGKNNITVTKEEA